MIKERWQILFCINWRGGSLDPWLAKDLLRSKVTWCCSALSTGHWRVCGGLDRALGWESEDLFDLKLFHLVAVWLKAYLSVSEPRFPFFQEARECAITQLFFHSEKIFIYLVQIGLRNCPEICSPPKRALSNGAFHAFSTHQRWIILLQNIVIANIMMKQYFVHKTF